MQHLQGLISDFLFPKKGWVDKWYFRADINLLEDKNNEKKKKKRLYSRSVLVTSLFPIEIIKTAKVKKKSPNEDAQAKYNEGHSSERVLNKSHILSLLQWWERSILPSDNNEWNQVRLGFRKNPERTTHLLQWWGLFCHQITINEAKWGVSDAQLKFAKY